ncbi:MAG: hypothetical protein EOO15_00485 [Chitinophagaceae bacterium]|nr:MAG: hypothetical protein EOO15_00485 [Chitinophagaceae bacterium]
MRASLLFTSLLLLLTAPARAQEDAPLHFQRIGGLPQNTAYAITRDHKGFIWVATGNGLARFDGQSMQPFPASGSTPLQGRIIRSDLLEDDRGQIWFATEKSVHRLSLASTRIHAETLAANRNSFASPLLRTGTQLWLASPTEGLYCINLASGQKKQYPVTVADGQQRPIPVMYNGACDGQERLWFASSKGLLSFNLRAHTWARTLEQHNYYTVAGARDTLFLGEGTQLSWFQPTTGRSGPISVEGIAPEKRALVRRIYADPDGNLWAGDEQGNVFCRRRNGSAFQWKGNINGNEAPRTNYPVYCFFADSSGTLWVGAYTLGLLKAVTDQPAFRRYGKDGPHDYFVNSIYEGDDGIWMGTYENGLLYNNRRGGPTQLVALPYSGPRLPYGNSVPLIAADRSGTLWTSRSGQLYYRRRSSRAFQSLRIPTPPEALQVPQLWTFSEGRSGCLLGTNVGLYWLSDSAEGPQLRHLEALGQRRVSATWMEPSGKAWIAFETGGVEVVDPLKKASGIKTLFPETQVRAFWCDSSRGLLWMAGTDGLMAWHLRSGLHRIYTEHDGLPARYLLSITGSSGELWVGSPVGLTRGTLAFGAGSVFPEIAFTNFTDADGLEAGALNPGAASRGASGSLYFGTTQGVIGFRPEALRSQHPLPLLRMIDLRVNELPADSSRTADEIAALNLSYRESNLVFRFRGIEYRNPLKVRYAYRLEGWDKGWVESGTLNEARYNNLPPGSYRFWVKAAGSSGHWTSPSLGVAVRIRPPLWQQTWFYALVALVVIAALIGGTRALAQRKLRRRLRALEAEHALEAERNRISKDMHDEIGSGLTQIALLSELMQTQKRDREELLRDVGNISASARRLVQNMGEIVWTLNPQFDSLENLLAFLREQAAAYFDPFDLELEIDFPEIVPAIRLSNEERRNLFLVAKEAWNNAFKHAGATRIGIGLEVKEQTLCFRVWDDGRGLSGSPRSGANGLRNMERRMLDIGGEFSIHSTNVGTTVRFTLLMRKSEI